MKLKPSFARHRWRPFLAGSFLLHGAVFAAGSLMMPSPEFQVVSGKNSLEVFILEKAVTQMAVESAAPPLATEAESELKAVVEEKEPSVEKERSQGSEKGTGDRTIVSPPGRGAVNDSKPGYLRNPAPVYPQLARQRGWQGTVSLKVLVNRSGSPENVLIEKSSGYEILDRSARQTVRRWKFKPAAIGGVAMDVWITIPVRFVLENEQS